MGSKGKNEETKRVKKVKTTNKKIQKNGKLKFRDKHPKLSKSIRIGLVVLMLLIIIGAGVLVGTFFGVFGEELKISEEDLVIKFKNSTVYDKDGNEIATLSGGTKRKIVSMTDMNEYLPKAFVAIEDERFYTHRGVDIKRTLAATATFILHAGDSSFGGSTITQQLVKNITTDDEDSGLGGALRKVKEMSKAIQVEQYLSKDQILELYLNIIFMGGNDINGVALGSVYYFDKDVKDLSVAECAYLAGINHSPNGYNPFKEDSEGKRQEKIKKRTKTVLAKMEELGCITSDQKNEAITEVDNGLAFKQGEGANVTIDISYHTEAAITQIIDQLLEEHTDWNKDMAELYLFSSGLKIYTTQDTHIQAAVEEELIKEDYIKHRDIKDPKTKEIKDRRDAIPTMVVVDHTTGQVVACATATGDKENRTTSTKLDFMNWPTELKKQTGSSMKPISVIVPGIETGTITAATTYLDCETKFAGMDRSMKNEKSYTNTLMSMREAIARSQNIPNAKAMMDIGVDKSIEFCKKMGITNLKDEGVSLALGGLNEGISPTHMAMAYATIANDGVYLSPTYYTKVTDENGETVLEPKQDETEVMSRESAYIVKSILTAPVLSASGTASYCKIQGIDTGAKTGTTNDSYDRWLCGFTPYYTAACWYGYEHSTEVTGFGRNPAGQIWSNVMKKIHTELPNASFEKPEGVVFANVCSVTGQLAVDGQCGAVYQEVFTEGTVPTACTGHTALPICVETGLISAGPCPTELRNFMVLPERETTGKWTNVNTAGFTTPPTDTCTVHTAPPVEQQQAPVQNPTPDQSQPVSGGNTGCSHHWEPSLRYPSCTAQGYRVDVCTICGAERDKRDFTPQTAHSYANGKCTVCGASDPNYQPPAQTTPPPTPPADNSGNAGNAGSSGDASSNAGADASKQKT